MLDPWVRYEPAIRLLGREAGGLRRTLDVGSGETGLARFLGCDVVGVDLEFPSARTGPDTHKTWLRPIKATATALPFRDHSFDAVVSMDMMEHLPAPDRTRALQEILRVARRTVIAGFPFGEISQEFDRSALIEERKRGIELGWRAEHVLRGTPGEELHLEILRIVPALRPGMKIEWFSHEGMRGLELRWRLQFLVSKDSRLYGPMFVPLYRLHAWGRPKNAYRRIYVFTEPGRMEGRAMPASPISRVESATNDVVR